MATTTRRAPRAAKPKPAVAPKPEPGVAVDLRGRPDWPTVTHRFVATGGQFYPGLPDRDITANDAVDGTALRRAIAEGVFEVAE
jgi:hypothetical protein